MDDVLARAVAVNHRLNAFTNLTPGRANAPPADGPLNGTSFAFKNLYDFEGLTTREGSSILADNPPAPED